MKNYLKNLNVLFKDELTQWFSMILCGSMCHKKGNITQSFTTLTKQSLFIFFIGGITIFSQTLDDYLKIAAENNPGLKSKFYSYQASLEKINQVGSLPDPQLSFGYFIEPMERYMGNQVADISIMQMFPWFGTLGSAEEEAALMAKAKYESFKETKSTLFYEVKSKWYEIYLLQKEITITKENLEILQTLEDLAINRVKSGGLSGSSNSKIPTREIPNMQSSTTGNTSGMNMDSQNSSASSSQKTDMSSMNNGGMQEMNSSGSMIDVLRVQMEINELKNKLALLEDSKQTLFVQFNNLLNRSSDEFINIPDTLISSQLPTAITDIPDSIRINNPMLRMLQKEEEAFIAQEEMNRKMGYPMIGLGLQYSIFQDRPGNMMTAQNMIMPMATISIPIWRGKYDGAIEESKLRQNEIGQQKRDAVNQLISKYEDVLTNFKDAERRIDLYDKQTKLTQQTFDLMLVQYSTSGSQFEEVLRLQQQLLDYRFKSLQVLVDKNIAVAMLERLMGR